MRRIICIILIIGLLSIFFNNPCLAQNNQAPESRPNIISTSPQEGALNVEIDTEIVIIFSKSMNNTSVQEAFQIYPFIPGTFSWELNNTIMIYDPIEDLVASDCSPNNYTVTIFKYASDQNQTNLKSDFNFAFTTKLLSGMGKISGYVTDINGNLLEGAKIFIEKYPLIKTNANGYYEREVTNGKSYDVNVQAEDHSQLTKNSGAICVGSNVSLNFELTPEDSERVDTINVCYYLGFILIIQIIIIAILYFSKKKKE